MRVPFHVYAALMLTVLIRFAPDGAATAKGLVIAEAAQAIPDLACDFGGIFKTVTDNWVQSGSRDEFARSVVRHMKTVGCNAACIHPVSVASKWDAEMTFDPQFLVGLIKRPITYQCYVARRGQGMVVTNTGDGGFINWAYAG